MAATQTRQQHHFIMSKLHAYIPRSCSSTRFLDLAISCRTSRSQWSPFPRTLDISAGKVSYFHPHSDVSCTASLILSQIWLMCSSFVGRCGIKSISVSMFLRYLGFALLDDRNEIVWPDPGGVATEQIFIVVALVSIVPSIHPLRTIPHTASFFAPPVFLPMGVIHLMPRACLQILVQFTFIGGILTRKFFVRLCTSKCSPAPWSFLNSRGSGARPFHPRAWGW